MVYESDFYTTRRYRTSPSLSTYTVSHLPSKQVRILPGIGKVHIVHTYDRIVPYVGHKRLTVVTTPPQTFRVRPSVLLKEFDRIQYRYRPAVTYSYVNNYLNSDSAVRVYNLGNSITDYRYDYTPSTVYYHSVIGRPARLYYDILGYPRWSRYWYRYWYNIPSSRYSDYYNSDLSYSSYWPSSLWYKYWSPSISWYNNYLSSLSHYKYPSLSWYNYTSPYYYKYWNTYDSPYYWTPYRSRYWRSLWSNYYRWHDLVFNDETSRIRADAAGLLKRIHSPVVKSNLPLLPYSIRYPEPILSSRITSDDYIYKMLNTSPYNSKVQYTTYYSEPLKRFLGPGHLAAITYSGGKAYGRRPITYTYDDPIKNDVQLLSYYIDKFRSQKALTAKESGSLSPLRPTRHFSAVKTIPDPVKVEKSDVEADHTSIRLSRSLMSQEEVEAKLKRQKEFARLAEEKALAEEAAKRKAQALKEEAERKAELARQEELAAQAAAERAAELERKAEQAKQEELAKQAEIERIKKEEEEKARLEEEKRLAELAKAEEERQQLLRLEEIARQAEEERERELARQAEELAELARQEAELEEQARQEAEALAQAKKEEELTELARQEAELQELEKQEKELAELARQEAELAEIAKHEADLAKQEAEIADLATQEAELAELQQRQLAELDALEAEAKALEQAFGDGEEPTTGDDGKKESAAEEVEVQEAPESTEAEPTVEEPEAEEEELAEEE